MKQIKASEVPKYRALYTAEQKGICPICKKPLSGVVALDHAHHSGKLRGSLHSSCNSAEGRTKEGAKRMQKGTHITHTDYLQYLNNLIEYLQKHEDNPRKVIHHTFDLATGKQKAKKRKPQRRKKLI